MVVVIARGTVYLALVVAYVRTVIVSTGSTCVRCRCAVLGLVLPSFTLEALDRLLLDSFRLWPCTVYIDSAFDDQISSFCKGDRKYCMSMRLACAPSNDWLDPSNALNRVLWEAVCLFKLSVLFPVVRIERDWHPPH